MKATASRLAGLPATPKAGEPATRGYGDFAHAILLGECKWTAEPIRKRIVEDFLDRACQVIPKPAEKWKVTYALFPRSDFTDEARQVAKGVKCLWVGLPQIDADLREV